MTKKFEDAMNEGLQTLSAVIIPKEETLEKADKVIKFISQKSKFSVDRACIAGSAGKKTTIIGSDIDIVLFINGKRPPFSDVLDDFENILLAADNFNIRGVHMTRFSIQFKAFDCEFDILPAANFTTGLQQGGDALIDEQQKRVLQEIAKDPKKFGYMYSSSLAFSAVRFMEKQEGFVNEMVRLAKFWFKTLHFDNLRSGEKQCIELIAVYAALKEMEMPNRSYLRTFNRFITCIQSFDDLNIEFGWSGHQTARPRVMDPVNPHNNLARYWNWDSIRSLKQYAGESSKRLQQLGYSSNADLSKLFEPQSELGLDIRKICGFDPTKSTFLVGTERYNKLPDLKVRNEKFHTDDKLKMFLDISEKYYKMAVYASAASGRGESFIKEAIQNTIDRQICNTGARTWGSSSFTDHHENYDITFTVPIDPTTAIRVSQRL